MLADGALIDAIRPHLPIRIDAAERWGSRPEHRVYRLVSGRDRFFLKVAPDVENERLRLEWLSNRINAPRVVASGLLDGVAWLATTEVQGDDLTSPIFRDRPAAIARLLAAALRLIHAVDVTDCPFDAPRTGDVLVHGDACLPNILVGGHAEFGYVDLADAACASPEVDLSAAVWSLHYNHGPGYGPLLLAEYGWPMTTDDEVERLRRQYEDG